MRLLRFLLQNLAVLGVFLLALLAYDWWRSDPQTVNRELPLHYPQEPARGSQGETVVASGVSVTVTGFERFPSVQAGSGLQLSSRARIDELTDFAFVALEIHNESADAVSFDYYGAGQRANVLLGTREPTPTTWLPLLPHDLQRLAVEQPLPATVIAPGESISGTMGYAINRGAREPALAILPALHFTPQGSTLPSFEIELQAARPD